MEGNTIIDSRGAVTGSHGKEENTPAKDEILLRTLLLGNYNF